MGQLEPGVVVVVASGPELYPSTTSMVQGRKTRRRLGGGVHVVYHAETVYRPLNSRGFLLPLLLVRPTSRLMLHHTPHGGHPPHCYQQQSLVGGPGEHRTTLAKKHELISSPTTALYTTNGTTPLDRFSKVGLRLG